MNQKSKDPYVDYWEKVAEKPMMVLSLIFAVIIVLPSADSLSPHIKTWLGHLDLAIWIIFAIDYFGKLFISSHRRRFFRTHLFELAIVVLPFARPLRLLRLVPLVGYFLRLTQQRLAGRILQFAVLAAVLIVVSSSLIMYEIERHAPHPNIKTLADAFWWSIASVTTVGYGDVYPTTGAGRSVAALVLVSGIVIVGIVTASIAATFIRSDEVEQDAVDMKALMRKLNLLEEKLDAFAKKSENRLDSEGEN
jgi:voltage-gated potassium channel